MSAIEQVEDVVVTATVENSVSKWSPGERFFNAIVGDLSKPIPERFLRTKPADRRETVILTYIPWHFAVKLLNFYAPGWTFEVRSVTNAGSKVIVVTRISIPCAEGIIFREATGQEDEDKETYGDSSSNAEGMSLRRCAAKFGLGLYLYDKDSEHAPASHAAPQPAASVEWPQQNKPREAVPPQQQNGDRQYPPAQKPADPLAKSMADLITPRQLGMVRAIAREAGVDVEDECMRALRCKTEEMSKKAASWFIDHLRGTNSAQGAA